MKTLGQTIRELREDRGISLREMAKNLDLSAAYISDVERGNRFPTESVLLAISKVLMIDFKLLRDLDPRPPFEELKHKVEVDPRYALALRSMVESDVTSQEILVWLKTQKKKHSFKR